MPTLPTLTITDQAIWDRVFTAFGGDPEKYKEWLKGAIAQYVKIEEALEAESQVPDTDEIITNLN